MKVANFLKIKFTDEMKKNKKYKEGKYKECLQEVFIKLDEMLKNSSRR